MVKKIDLFFFKSWLISHFTDLNILEVYNVGDYDIGQKCREQLDKSIDCRYRGKEQVLHYMTSIYKVEETYLLLAFNKTNFGKRTFLCVFVLLC